MLERDAPLPSCLVRGRTSERAWRRDDFARYRDRSIALKPPSPIFVAGLKRLFDKKFSKPRTVDEQIGRNIAYGIEKSSIGVRSPSSRSLSQWWCGGMP